MPQIETNKIQFNSKLCLCFSLLCVRTTANDQQQQQHHNCTTFASITVHYVVDVVISSVLSSIGTQFLLNRGLLHRVHCAASFHDRFFLDILPIYFLRLNSRCPLKNRFVRGVSSIPLDGIGQCRIWANTLVHNTHRGKEAWRWNLLSMNEDHSMK